MKRKFGIAAMLVVLTAVLLELVLQVGALVLSSSHGGGAAAVDPADGRRVVLCLGDSFTFGLGASDPERFAYPPQLQRVLDERATDTWRVVNAGWPGLNSRQILAELPANLARTQPAAVVLLCGLNDRWVKPERLVLDDAAVAAAGARGFRLEWRTKRFVLWALGKLRGDADDAPDAAADVDPAAVLAVSPASDDPWWLLVAGDAAAATTAFAARVDGSARIDPWDLAGYALAVRDVAPEASGRSSRADASMRSLAVVAGSPADELLGIARGDAPRDLRKAVDALPANGSLDVRHAFVLDAAADAFAATAPVLSIRCAVRATWLDGSIDRLGRHAEQWSPELFVRAVTELAPDPARGEATVASFAEQRGFERRGNIWRDRETQRWHAVVTPQWLQAGGELEQALEYWRDHVRQIVARVRASGARIALLNYPNRAGFPPWLSEPSLPESLVAELAAELDVSFIRTVERFEARLGDDGDAKTLFVADAHCTDAGYGLLAEIVAGWLLEAR